MVPFPAFPRKGLIMEQFISYAAAALLVGSFAALQWYGRKYYAAARGAAIHYRG
jgi:uncharacterized membrane protein